MSRFNFILVAVLFASCSKAPTIKPDVTSPEGAVLALEAVYRHKDIEAAVSAKDFQQDAFYFLGLQFGSDMGKTKEMAAALETNFRREMTQNGFPDYSGIESSFVTKEMISADRVILTERCKRGDTYRDMRLILVMTNRG